MSPTRRSADRPQGHHLSAHKEIPLSVDTILNRHRAGFPQEEMAHAGLEASRTWRSVRWIDGQHFVWVVRRAELGQALQAGPSVRPYTELTASEAGPAQESSRRSVGYQSTTR